MKTFTENLKTANSTFRQAFYDTVVKDLGLGIGAVVKVKQRRGYSGEFQEVIGIIDGFDLSELNIFSTNTSMDTDYRGFANITVTVGNERFSLDLTTNNSNNYYGRKPRQDSQGRTIVRSHNHWGSVEYRETIARSTNPLDESWVSTEALANEFEWVTKKRSKEWLDTNGVIDTVKEWV